jgi:CheY-like chemotaxis protein
MELRRHGLRVLVARSGIEVVSLLFPRGDAYALEPGLMVLSATLPGYNGLSVLAGVRSMGWRTPVVMTWPSSEAWVANEALRLGCSGLFEEPIDPKDLAATVLQITGAWPESVKDQAATTRGTAA